MLTPFLPGTAVKKVQKNISLDHITNNCVLSMNKNTSKERKIVVNLVQTISQIVNKLKVHLTVQSLTIITSKTYHIPRPLNSTIHRGF